MFVTFIVHQNYSNRRCLIAESSNRYEAESYCTRCVVSEASNKGNVTFETSSDDHRTATGLNQIGTARVVYCV